MSRLRPALRDQEDEFERVRFEMQRERVEAYERLLGGLAGISGVQRVSTVSGLPPHRQFNAIATDVENSPLRLEGRTSYVVDYCQTVSVGAVETLGIPILRSVVLDGTKPALIGLVAGLASALALTHLIESMLFGVQAHDPTTLAGVAAVITIVAVMASLVPAYRATRVDPATVLRSDR
jgi:hypothetical protein